LHGREFVPRLILKKKLEQAADSFYIFDNKFLALSGGEVGCFGEYNFTQAVQASDKISMFS